MFPDATVVFTHRDPVDVVVSMATMITYSARMYTDRVDAPAVGRAWAQRIGDLLDACVADRAVFDAGHSIDVRFDDFLADELGTVRAVYGVADQPVDAAAEAALTGYLDGHRRGRHGTIDYRAADVGLDPGELRERFAPYAARFL